MTAPDYYKLPGGLETLDIIACVDCFDGFTGGNALKYLTRAGQKEDYAQDLRKARDYIEFMLQPPPLKEINLVEVAEHLNPNVSSAFLAMVMALQSSDKSEKDAFLQEAMNYLNLELTAVGLHNFAQATQQLARTRPITAIKHLREQGFSLGEAHRAVTEMNF